jgi:thiamine-phosphate pyrophosphorylase
MVIVNPQQVPQDQLARFCHAVSRGGVTSVQLRDKTRATRELVDYGQELGRLCRQWGMTFVVNDRVDIALAVGADGVHVGQTDMAVATVRRICPRLRVGLSISSEEEALAADQADYYGVGPIFPTPSKMDAAPSLGLEGLQRIVRILRSKGPVVAIGGIQIANSGVVWALGVDGLAVISAIIDAPDYEAACRALLHK